MRGIAGDPSSACLLAARLPEAAIEAWLLAEPATADMFSEDCRAYAEFWRLSDQLLARLPQRSARNPAQAEAASSIHRKARETRECFLRRHVEAAYATITQGFSRF